MKHPLAAFAAVLLAGAAPAQPPLSPAGQQALDLLTRSIAFRTVEGQHQVPAYAAFLRERLIALGFAPADISFTAMGETGYLLARYPGRDRAAKPVVLLDHMDVVEAKRENWTRDPFVPVVENGFVYGRGALDVKGDVATLITALGQLRKAGWVPARDMVLALSGDEETHMVTGRALAAALNNAELVLNGDAGGGLIGEDGKPVSFHLSAAEKVYADFALGVDDPGGHSSRPGAVNAIYRLNAGLAKLAAYRFPAALSPVTTAYFTQSAARVALAIGAAMRAYAADPANEAAAATLSADPEYVGLVRTTCVATMIQGGHAPNALPQHAEANVNCRIFPGTHIKDVSEEIARIVADPGITVRFTENGSIEAPESPLRPDVVAAMKAAIAARGEGDVPVIPAMDAGASDSMFFRAEGVPAYGVGSAFIKSSDDFAHGLNERLPVATIDPGIRQWETLLRTLLR